jgi:hypothetical protein
MVLDHGVPTTGGVKTSSKSHDEVLLASPRYTYEAAVIVVVNVIEMVWNETLGLYNSVEM